MDAKTYITSPSFCPAPWCNIYIEPNGDVRTCSIGKTILGNVNDQDIETILANSAKLKQIKQEMLIGEKTEQCKVCWDIEKFGTGYSSRIHYKKMCKTVDLSLFDNVDNFFTNTIDLRWSNACQNACVYCGPVLSSQWAKILSEKPKIETQNFFKSKQAIYDKLANVKEVYLAGGEPLIAKENLKLLQVLHEVNPDVNLRINTNIVNLDTPTYELCKQFKNLQFTVSVEALGKKFEYIRWPQTWKNFTQNLDIVQQEIPSINFNMVYNVLNSEEILNTIDYFLSEGRHENEFIITHASRPIWMDVNNLSNDWLKQVYNKTKQLQKQTDSQFFLYNALEGVLQYINYNTAKDIQHTINNLCKLDYQRNLNSKKLFPEVYKHLIS